MESVSSILMFLQDYLVPIIFALGLISFIYGYVNSFMLGRGDIGHPHLLRSLMFFTVALICYGILAFILWSFSFYSTFKEEQGNTPSRPGVEVDRGRSLLPTPNAPTGNTQ